MCFQAYLDAAEGMLASDLASNKAIGAFGAEALSRQVEGTLTSGQGMRVLTHCNTGRYERFVSQSRLVLNSTVNLHVR